MMTALILSPHSDNLAEQLYYASSISTVALSVTISSP